LEDEGGTVATEPNNIVPLRHAAFIPPFRMWHEWPCPMAMEEIQAKKRDGQLSRMRKSCAVVVWEIFCWEGLEVMYAIVMYLHLERKQEIACRFSTWFLVMFLLGKPKYRKVLRVHA